MRIIHQGPRASSPDSQAEYTQAIRPRFCLLLENALQFGGSPYTGLGGHRLRARVDRSTALAEDQHHRTKPGDERYGPLTSNVGLDPSDELYLRSEERRVGKECRARWVRSEDETN